MKTENRYFIFDNPIPNAWKRRAKAIQLNSRAILAKARMNRIRLNPAEKKYRVSVCAIFRNEAPYFKEWLTWHELVGVDHFYLYDNKSTDDFREELAPFIDRGLVTLVDWPYDQKQMECYTDCIARFREETNWLGFIDLDEFIVPKAMDSVYDFLKPFEKKRGSVCIYWRLYGSSGRLDRDLSGLVTEDFTVCWPKYCDIGKCFYNTAFDFNAESDHVVGMHHLLWSSMNGKELPPVNFEDRVCMDNRNSVHTADFPIQINHYFTKSWTEYAMKRSKGDVFFTVNPHDEAYFFRHEMPCTGTDYSAYRWLIRLKLALEKNHG